MTVYVKLETALYIACFRWFPTVSGSERKRHSLESKVDIVKSGIFNPKLVSFPNSDMWARQCWITHVLLYICHKIWKTLVKWFIGFNVCNVCQRQPVQTVCNPFVPFLYFFAIFRKLAVRSTLTHRCMFAGVTVWNGYKSLWVELLTCQRTASCKLV